MTAPKLPTRLRCCWPECHYEWDTPLTAHDYELCPRCYSSFTINKPYTLRAAMRAATAGSGEASAVAAASAAHVAPPVSASFDAALAGLDVEAVDCRDDGTAVWEWIGLDDVRAAHAEAVRVAVEAEGRLWDQACADVRDRTAEVWDIDGVAALCHDGEDAEAVRVVVKHRRAAAIRARGVAKPRTDGEAATRSGEGAKS